MDGWSFVRSGAFQDEVVGPIESNEELFQYFVRGDLKPSSQTIHPVATKGQWLALNTLPIFQQFEQAIKAHEDQKREAKKNEEAVRRAQQQAVSAEDEKRRLAEAEARQLRAGQQRQLDVERQVHSSRVREQEGADRWPQLVRYAQFLDVWGMIIQILVSVLLSLPAAFMIISALLSFVSMIAGGAISLFGVAFLFGSLLVAALIIALACGVAYLVRLAIGATADFLKCIAAIESNTRRLWESGAVR